MNYAVNTNSIRKQMTPGEIARIASRAGCAGIEWGLPAADEAADYVREAVKATQAENLKIAGFLNGGKIMQDKFDRDEIETFCRAIDEEAGETLDDDARVPLRVNPAWFAFDLDESMHQRDSFRDLQDRTRRNLESIVPLSEQYGVRFVFETHHGNVCASAPLARELVDGLDPAAVGVLWDPANGVHEGFLRPRISAEYLGEYLASVHVKNIVRTLNAFGENDGGMPVRADYSTDIVTAPDAGMIDWVEVLMALKLVGYDGWLSFEEFFGADTTPRLKRARAFMEECLNAAPNGPIEPHLTMND